MTDLLQGFLSGSAAWGVLLTLAAFALGALINKTTGKAIFNPLLLGSIFVIILLSVLNIPYADYKVSAAPVNYLLLPATISLAIPLYEKWDLLKENAAAIIAGISVGTLVSLGSALALALALDLTREQYATLLPKSVTTAISMDVAAELGGIAALMMTDLDNLKKTSNDTYGHDWGDIYLRQTAHSLRQGSPSGTVVARPSGGRAGGHRRKGRRGHRRGGTPES